MGEDEPRVYGLLRATGIVYHWKSLKPPLVVQRIVVSHLKAEVSRSCMRACALFVMERADVVCTLFPICILRMIIAKIWEFLNMGHPQNHEFQLSLNTNMVKFRRFMKIWSTML